MRYICMSLLLAVLCPVVALAAEVTASLTQGPGGSGRSFVRVANNSTDAIMPVNPSQWDHLISLEANATLTGGTWTVYAKTDGGQWQALSGTISGSAISPVMIEGVTTSALKIVPSGIPQDCSWNATVKSR